MKTASRLLALCLSLPTLCAQTAPRPPQPQGGPYFHEVHSASSQDGLAWTRDPGVRLRHASVPCALTVEDKIFIYFVDAGAGPDQRESASVAVSTDGMNFELKPLDILDMRSPMKALDPSIVRAGDGKFWLYYFGCRDTPDEPGNHEIHVATSDDGIIFREKGCVYDRPALVDPDVFFFKGQWWMYVFGNRQTEVATSANGLDFTYQHPLSLQGWGTVAPVRLDKDTLRLYAFDQRTHNGNTVASFVSTDAMNWKQEDGIRLKADDGEQITDPYVVKWKDGWKMFFKSDKVTPRQQPRMAMQPQGPSPYDALLAPSLPFASIPSQPAQMNRETQNGPWQRDVLVQRADDDGKVSQVHTFERAGVPTMERLKDGRILAAFQNFPKDDERNFDRVAVSFSADDGATWSKPEPIAVEGMEQGLARPFDPTLVPLPDGRIRLYFTSNRSLRFEESTPAIYSAISDDGIHYKFEPGVRFAIEGRVVIDCAACLHNGTFHLIVPDNGTADDMRQDMLYHTPPRFGIGYHAISKDGLTFERVNDVKIDGNIRWLGNMLSDGTKMTFVGTGNAKPGTRSNLWMATSTDGATWNLFDAPAMMGADPGAVSLKDGGWLLITTGEPRN